MHELGDLYQEIILDHYKKPRNAGQIDQPTCSATGDNPLCGDKLAMTVKLKGDTVEDLRWKGAGCAISTASASMMTESLKGKTRAEADALFDRFHGLITGAPEARNAPPLGKLEVFAGVREFPIRVKCATLPWHTLKAALQGSDAPVSTESEGPTAESGGA